MEESREATAVARRGKVWSARRLAPVAAGPVAAGATATTSLALPLTGRSALVVWTIPGSRPVMSATVLPPRTARTRHRTTLRLLQPRHVVEQAASLLIRYEAGRNRGHHPPGRPELFEKVIEREPRAGEGRSEGPGSGRSVAGGAAGRLVQVGVRDGRPFGQRSRGRDHSAGQQEGKSRIAQHDILRVVRVHWIQGGVNPALN
jgi:hypothetical protein